MPFLGETCSPKYTDRSGIGREIALEALRRGDKVIATSRGSSQHKLSDLKILGATTMELDVTSSLDDYDTQYAADLAAEADVALVFITSDSGEDLVVVEGTCSYCNHSELITDTTRRYLR